MLRSVSIDVALLNEATAEIEKRVAEVLTEGTTNLAVSDIKRLAHAIAARTRATVANVMLKTAHDVKGSA